MDRKLIDKLSKRNQEGTKRSLSFFEDGIDFYSNDYLGLARQSIPPNIKNYFGSTGSRLISGNSTEAINCEEFLANFYKVEKALVFNSGYDANLGFFGAVPQRGDTVIYDEHIHASVRDGIRLSFADSFSFEHNSLSDIERLIERSRGTVYVAIESLYSMGGDFSPLKDIAKMCSENGAYLVVDEAHACGVFGEEGRGLVDSLNIVDQVFARIVTFGKAYGIHGACVLGQTKLIEFLVNFSRSFIYTTALPPKDYIQIKNNVEFAKDENLRSHLQDNIYDFVNQLKIKGLTSERISPIQMIRIGSVEKCQSIAESLLKNGIIVKPIYSPTVKKGGESIRICIHSFNTKQEIEKLCSILNNQLFL
jgi:8-amino-7-oxononanoate synthase